MHCLEIKNKQMIVNVMLVLTIIITFIISEKCKALNLTQFLTPEKQNEDIST